jgi:hypothetical protein
LKKRIEEIEEEKRRRSLYLNQTIDELNFQIKSTNAQISFTQLNKPEEIMITEFEKKIGDLNEK